MRSNFHGSAGRSVPFFAMVSLVALITLLGSCASVPTSVPEDFTSAEIIQKAQEASDRYNYKAAQFYYTTAQERFGSDPVIGSTCMYELAFIAYKQGRYDEARAGFNALIEFYAQPGNESLPVTYRILALKILEKLPAAKTPKPAVK